MDALSHAIVQFDNARGTNPTWNIDAATGAFLQSIIISHEYTRALEIGTSTGYSALHLAQALRKTHGMLITVESHADRWKEATNQFQQAGITDVVSQIFGHAPEILSEIDGLFDFIFLDATKYEHSSYVAALSQKLIPGATIISDNMSSHAEQMQPFLNQMNQDTRFTCELVHIGTGLLVCRFQT